MYFDDWENYPNARLRDSLLWEYNIPNFDWERMKHIVVQRVIERGLKEDWYAAINLYGGLNKFREIIKDVPHLNDKDLNFVCRIFNLKKEELRCYTRKQLREKLFNS